MQDGNAQHERELREQATRYERLITDLKIEHEASLRRQAEGFADRALLLATGKIDGKMLMAVIVAAIAAATFAARFWGK